MAETLAQERDSPLRRDGGQRGLRIPNAALIRGLWRLFAALASGLVLAAAFPPLSDSTAAWLGLVPLLLLARRSAGAG